MNDDYKFDTFLKIVIQKLAYLGLFVHPCELFFYLTLRNVNIFMYTVYFESLAEHLRANGLLVIYPAMSKDKSNRFCHYIMLVVKLDSFQCLRGGYLKRCISSNWIIKRLRYRNHEINSISCSEETLVYIL